MAISRASHQALPVLRSKKRREDFLHSPRRRPCLDPEAGTRDSETRTSLSASSVRCVRVLEPGDHKDCSHEMSIFQEATTRSRCLIRTDGSIAFPASASIRIPALPRTDCSSFTISSKAPYLQGKLNDCLYSRRCGTHLLHPPGFDERCPAFHSSVKYESRHRKELSVSLHVPACLKGDHFAYFLNRSLIRPQCRFAIKLSMYAARFGPSL